MCLLGAVGYLGGAHAVLAEAGVGPRGGGAELGSPGDDQQHVLPHGLGEQQQLLQLRPHLTPRNAKQTRETRTDHPDYEYESV